MKQLVVDAEALRNNYNIIRQKVERETVIYLIVKGNAYGLDTKMFVQEMIDAGVRHFATTDIKDAVLIKKLSENSEVLLLTPVNSEYQAEITVNYGIVATVENTKGAEYIAEFSEEAYPVHIKIDVGFGRYGVEYNDLHKISEICNSRKICVEGVFAHLPKCCEIKKKDTLKMIYNFFGTVDFIKSLGIEPKRIHALGSVGVFRFWDDRFTAVRVGSAMIGRMPAVVGETGLKRVAYLECSINSIKSVDKGHCVGYSGLYKTKRKIISAVLDVGYSDGFAVSKVNNSFRKRDICRYIKCNLGSLLHKPYITANINDQKIRSIGSIGMTSSSFDVTDINIKYSDKATIDVNPIYISPSVPRIYINKYADRETCENIID